MNYEKSKLKGWLQTKEPSLPGITDLLSQAKSEILIIGAAVFELYEIQKWIPPFKRKTGDIDLSIGILTDNSLYEEKKSLLVSLQYAQDRSHPYRFHPPRAIPGGYSYIDLLAHPANPSTHPEIASQAMGVGPSFSFRGFHFAQEHAYELQDKILFPNPFGLIALKREGYLGDPTKRKKDFTDIVELISGMVETGLHFEMQEKWSTLAHHTEAQELKLTIRLMLSENPQWDLETVHDDLVERGFEENFIQTTLVQRLRDFVQNLS